MSRWTVSLRIPVRVEVAVDADCARDAAEIAKLAASWITLSAAPAFAPGFAHLVEQALPGRRGELPRILRHELLGEEARQEGIGWGEQEEFFPG